MQPEGQFLAESESVLAVVDAEAVPQEQDRRFVAGDKRLAISGEFDALVAKARIVPFYSLIPIISR